MASKKYFVDIDLNLNELKSIVVHKLSTSSEPSGTAGQIYYNTNTNIIRFHNGSIWQDIASGSVGFDDLLTGTNTTATMVVGTGATLYYTGSGSINASQLQGYNIVPLSIGGTQANLTASNGGIVYSTASAMAILSGTATAGQIIRSGASGAPSWSTATYPATASSAGTVLRANGTNWVASTSTFADAYTQYSILYASTANTITGLTTTNDSVLSTNGSGVPSWVSITSLIDAVIRVPGSSSYNIIQPTTTDVTGLIVRQSSSISSGGNVFTVQTPTGTNVFRVLRNSGVSNTYEINFNTNAGTGTLGYIKMDSFSGKTTGFIDLSASSANNGGSITAIGASGGEAGSITLDGGSGGAGGYIETYGGSGAAGGYISTRGGTAAGGHIDTHGGSAAGGSITTSIGGGSIDTTGNGLIEFGTSANRITLQGTTAANGKTIILPAISGTVVVTSGEQEIDGIKTFTENVHISPNDDSTHQIKFYELGTNGTNYIGLCPPDSIAANVTYLLPPNGSSGQFLKLVDNSTGELGWDTLTGGTGFVLLVPTSSADNIIQPTVADVESLKVRQSSGTFATAQDIFAVQTNGGTNIFEVYRSATSTYAVYFNTNAGTGGTLGYIKMDSFSGKTTGNIDTSATLASSGGNISTKAGAGAGGGSLTARGGSSTGGSGGSLNLDGGTTGAGGSLNLSGNGAFGGGNFNLNASSTAAGGTINLSGGTGSGSSGTITMQGGSSSGNAGSITMSGGSSGTSGSINLSASSAVSGGSLTSTAGATVSGNAGGAGGSLSMAGGTGASGGTGGAGGSLTLTGGAGAASGNGGASGSITLSGGAGASASGPTAGGTGGTITMTGGASGGGTAGRNAGSINLSAGSLSTNVGGTGGSITAQGGAGAGGVFGSSAGSIDLSAGNSATSNVGGTGGNITMTGGVAAASSAAGGNAGSITTSGGNASSSSHPGGAGGSINTSGSAATSTANGAAGGSINLSAGTSGANSTTGGAGGSITMTGGNASGTTGGSGGASGTINLAGSSGSGATAGTAGGSISMSASGANAGGSINLSGGGTAAGGSLTMNNGGGSIDTTGSGSIQLGVSATRTTIIGSGSAVTYILPTNGSNGQFLQLSNNSTGQLTWATPTGTVLKYSTDFTFGGSGTVITVTHNLSTQYVIVRIYDSSWQEVYPQVVSTSSTQATITFAADQGTNSYHIVVMG